MFFQPKQLIVAGAAGLVTAVIVAGVAVQLRSRGEPDDPSAAESPVPVAPADVSETPETRPIVVKPPSGGCEISMAVVEDPDPPLNVRSVPQVQDGNIVGQLPNGTFVSVADEQSGWLQISDPVSGWVAKNRTRSSCPNVVQPIQFFPGGNSARVTGEIIGGGSHSYTLDAEAGQTLAVESETSVFPRIITPDGQLLGEDRATVGGQQKWSGKLPTSGTYTFQLDSNFRGFEYDFLVRVE